MRRHLTIASFLSLLVLALVAALVGAGPATAAKGGKPGATTYPASMASLGDSITRGFNVSGWFSDWPGSSWSTGTDSSVGSHYTRLRAVNRKMGSAWNDARSGARMGELASQAATARSQGAQYVTILMGANDACTDTEQQMTPVSTFRDQFAAGLQTLADQATPPKVLVASIPDLERLWAVGRSSSSARTAWSAYGICQSMLANPTSTDQADVDRRARVRQRVMDYNAQLASVCSSHAFCRYDGGAVFGYPFALSHLSSWDYFHPNASGQAVLADVTWSAGFWPTK